MCVLILDCLRAVEALPRCVFIDHFLLVIVAQTLRGQLTQLGELRRVPLLRWIVILLDLVHARVSLAAEVFRVAGLDLHLAHVDRLHLGGVVGFK